MEFRHSPQEGYAPGPGVFERGADGQGGRRQGNISMLYGSKPVSSGALEQGMQSGQSAEQGRRSRPHSSGASEGEIVPYSCSHMGSGNYMDYQTNTDLIEFADIAPASQEQDDSPGSSNLSLASRQVQIEQDWSSDSIEDEVKVPEALPVAVPPFKCTPKECFIRLCSVMICLCFGFTIISPVFLTTPISASVEYRVSLIKKALKEVPLIDGHNDFPYNVLTLAKNNISSFNFSKGLQDVYPWSTSVWSHTDLPRLRAGGVGAQFWSVHVPCSTQWLDSVQRTLVQIDIIKKINTRYKDSLVPATSSEDILEAHSQGKIASLIGVEGGHSLGNSFGVLRAFYDLGVRYLTISRKCSTIWADCCLSDPPVNPKGQSKTAPKPGLTDFGKLVVREMNRLGMLIDLAHSSIQTMKDVLETSKAPVIFSHTGAHALCNASGNVPDDVLKMVAKNGGIVMVSFSSNVLTCSDESKMEDVIAHINHIRDVVGIDHVGLGASFDGINNAPVGLENVSKYPDLLVALLRDPTWTLKDIMKLMGLNFLRVLREAELVKFKWRLADVRPVEDFISYQQLEGKNQCMTPGL